MRQQVLPLIRTFNVYLIAAIVLVLPFFFLPITTDALEMPKQILFVGLTLVLLLSFGLVGILEERSSFRRTPLDLGFAVLFVAILVSVLTSQSRSTSLISAIPFLSLIVFSFLTINSINNEEEERLVIMASLVSASILAVLSVLQFLKVYILPYPLAQTPGFSLAGSMLAAVIFIVCLLPTALSYLRSYFQKVQDEIFSGFFIGVSVLIIIGASLGIYQLVTAANPILLSQNTGLRTALQPLGLNFQTALFGTGPGTYLFNFTRFKDAPVNNTNLWALRFTNSSSLFLEIISTFGLIGAISFLFFIFRVLISFFKSTGHNVKTVGIFLSLVLAFLLSFLLPFSFLSMFLLFFLLALYCVRLANEGSPHVFEVTISVVALRKGLISLERNPTEAKPATELLPSILFIVFAAISVLLGFNMYRFVLSDITFQNAIVAANQNQARQTYDLQNQAIQTFSDRDLYHRVFSQTNLAIATSIVAQGAANPGGISAQDRQNITTLVQQSINFGRNAVTLSPVNVVNWENLTNVYRAIIGFAQNADQFAIASANQAIALDPVNPLLRLTLGGIYYQLGLYDLAADQFRTAVGLKNDFANGHYNLGHAFEAKGDQASLAIALSEYQIVRSLVESNSEDFKRIEAEIAALQKKLPGAEKPTPPGEQAGGLEQEPLKISTPSSTLPEQKPPVEVEGPPPPATTSGEENK